mmetsp:Transcript_14951/g.33300  ORF Transcript_14951/g.33300 Transcript_14951/m.33300 type:complete len:398 (+) Transcript_14951:690-1883(+)
MAHGPTCAPSGIQSALDQSFSDKLQIWRVAVRSHPQRHRLDHSHPGFLRPLRRRKLQRQIFLLLFSLHRQPLPVLGPLRARRFLPGHQERTVAHQSRRKVPERQSPRFFHLVAERLHKHTVPNELHSPRRGLDQRGRRQGNTGLSDLHRNVRRLHHPHRRLPPHRLHPQQTYQTVQNHLPQKGGTAQPGPGPLSPTTGRQTLPAVLDGGQRGLLRRQPLRLRAGRRRSAPVPLGRGGAARARAVRGEAALPAGVARDDRGGGGGGGGGGHGRGVGRRRTAPDEHHAGADPEHLAQGRGGRHHRHGQGRLHCGPADAAASHGDHRQPVPFFHAEEISGQFSEERKPRQRWPGPGTEEAIQPTTVQSTQTGGGFRAEFGYDGQRWTLPGMTTAAEIHKR